MFYNSKMTEVINPRSEIRELEGLCAEGTQGLFSQPVSLSES